jgi:hypothetical protein
MSDPALWLSFLEGADAGPAPRLRIGPEPDAPEIPLTDRARWVLAAVSLPRELTPEAASDERQRARLGSRLWSSGEIMGRIPYQHRSTIRLALGDLRGRLAERQLLLEDYLLIDTDRGRYGIRSGRLNVDLVELYAARGDPDALDQRLDAELPDRRRARLASVCTPLLADTPLRELKEAISASAARAPDPMAWWAEGSPPPPEATATEAPGPRANERSQESDQGWPPARPRHHAMLVRGLLAAAVIVAVVALIPMLASGHHRRIHALGPPRREVSGGVAHTWSNPHLAGGRDGPEIMKGQSVLIACRLRGYKVQDGNVWWYQIASAPWSKRYYATADTFYNNGRTSGSLRGSAFVDPGVARCS